jgi:integrase
MKDWKKTQKQNLLIHVPSGTYYLRKSIKGKIIRKSLDTKVFTVASARLPLKIEELTKQALYRGNSTEALSSIEDCIRVAKWKQEKKAHLRPGAVLYRQTCFKLIEKTFPALEKIKPKALTPSLCSAWLLSIKPPRYSAAFCNNALGTLRMIVKEALDCGLITVDPTKELKKFRVQSKRLQLPSPEQFKLFVQAIRKPQHEKKHSWRSDACADFVEFCAYSGVRKDGANNVKWSDINEHNQTIHVVEKGGYARHIPIVRAMKELLERLPKRGDLVLRVKEAEQSMTRAAKEIGMERITHHDLRHLFATTCLESGVDIPTVSRWLGHKDGGTLALKTYGHLRESHSSKAAERVVF